MSKWDHESEKVGNQTVNRISPQLAMRLSTYLWLSLCLFSTAAGFSFFCVISKGYAPFLLYWPTA